MRETCSRKTHIVLLFLLYAGTLFSLLLQALLIIKQKALEREVECEKICKEEIVAINKIIKELSSPIHI